MEDDGIFYGHLVQFTVFCYILWTFGIDRGNLAYFFPFGYFVPRKIWQPRTRGALTLESGKSPVKNVKSARRGGRRHCRLFRRESANLFGGSNDTAMTPFQCHTNHVQCSAAGYRPF
jgi:hypothetical protein